MVRGMTRVMIGIAVVVARTALAAAPATRRGGAKAAADGDTVTPIVPEQGDAPEPDEAETDGPDLDPAAQASEAAEAAAPEAAAPEDLVTKDGEDPWTEAEVAEVHDELSRRAAELRAELVALDADLDGLIRGSGEGTGQDSADVGSASSERDQEISLVNNARAMLHQTERALERLAEGSFGVCESCGGAIGKMRVMAFPRATLCLSCKQREERR